MTSALFSKTSWRVMMFECWISFRMFTSRSMSSLDTPRRLDLLRLFLMNLAAYSTPVLLCRHLLTTANCPLEKGGGETAEGVSRKNNDSFRYARIFGNYILQLGLSRLHQNANLHTLSPLYLLSGSSSYDKNIFTFWSDKAVVMEILP